MQWRLFLRVSIYRYRYRNRHSAPSVSVSAARHPSADNASHATATLTPVGLPWADSEGVRCQGIGYQQNHAADLGQTA